MSLHVVNLGGILRSDPAWHLDVASTELVCDSGQIVAMGSDASERLGVGENGRKPVVVDAQGLVAVPGLIDGHIHPTVGAASFFPPSADWASGYLEAGVTSMVSAGELTMPGFDARTATPDEVASLASFSAWSHSSVSLGPSIYAGTLLAVPGLGRHHFESVAKAGGRCIKYIYYPFDRTERYAEVGRYAEWASDLGLITKLHCGGTSYQGHTSEVGAEIAIRVAPNVLAHLNGGPIPMADDDIATVISNLSSAVEVIPSGNIRALLMIVEMLVDRQQTDRIVVGTDTPGGNGITPRGCLQLVSLLASVGGLGALEAIRCATQNVALQHGIPGGEIALGKPADVALMGPVRGSSKLSLTDCLESGEIPGIGAVIKGGRLAALPARFTPPPRSMAFLREEK